MDAWNRTRGRPARGQVFAHGNTGFSTGRLCNGAPAEGALAPLVRYRRGIRAKVSVGRSRCGYATIHLPCSYFPTARFPASCFPATRAGIATGIENCPETGAVPTLQRREWL